MTEKVMKMAPKQKAQEKNKDVMVEKFAQKAGEIINLIGMDVVKDEDALNAFQKYTATMSATKAGTEKLHQKSDKIKEILKKYSGIRIAIEEVTKEDYDSMADDGSRKLIKRRLYITYFGDPDLAISTLVEMLRTSDDESQEELEIIANTMLYHIFHMSEFIASVVSMRAIELDTKCFMYASMRCLDESPVHYSVFKEGIIKDIEDYVYSVITKEEIANMYYMGFGFK